MRGTADAVASDTGELCDPVLFWSVRAASSITSALGRQRRRNNAIARAFRCQPRPEAPATAMNQFPNGTKFSKVPEVTLIFWIIKIAATTLGETGGDTVTMTLTGVISPAPRCSCGACSSSWWSAQIAREAFHPLLYWATIVASTTFGTTMADFADRSLGIGYTGGSRCCWPAAR